MKNLSINRYYVACFVVAILGIVSGWFHWLAMASISLVATTALFLARMSSEKERRLASYKEILSAREAVDSLPTSCIQSYRREVVASFCTRVRHHIECWPNDGTGKMREFRAFYLEWMNDW